MRPRREKVFFDRREELDGFVGHCTDVVLYHAYSGATCEMLRSVRCDCRGHENGHSVACGVCDPHIKGHFQREEQLYDVRNRWWPCAGHRHRENAAIIFQILKIIHSAQINMKKSGQTECMKYIIKIF